MIVDQLLIKLTEVFAQDIYTAGAENANELYLEVNPEKILEISSYIHLELGYPLILMFANDEQSLKTGYAIYYVFADRTEGLLLIIKTLVDSGKMEILSLSKNIPSASLYEREINDLFGIVPVGHPEAKRLVFHGNWPDGEYPLRKEFDVRHKPVFAKKKRILQRSGAKEFLKSPWGLSMPGS